MKKIRQLLGTPLPGQNITDLPELGHLRLWLCNLLLVGFLWWFILAFTSTRRKILLFCSGLSNPEKSRSYSTPIGGVLSGIEHLSIPGPASIALCVQGSQTQHRQPSQIELIHAGKGRVTEKGLGLLAFATGLGIALAVAQACRFALKKKFFFLMVKILRGD